MGPGGIYDLLSRVYALILWYVLVCQQLRCHVRVEYVVTMYVCDYVI
jgi:hypothetical protein